MIVEILEPLTVRLEGEVRQLDPGPVDLPDVPARKLLERRPDKVRAIASPQAVTYGQDKNGSICAVKVGGSIIGEFWFCLSESEPFDPGDCLPIYRPSEIRALVGKGYGSDALQAVHRIKTTFDGKVGGLL